jgi:hypothetical protein
MADTIIFLGPSLSLEKARQILPDALYLPPIKCGDILDILILKPQKIAIIDGYFDSVAAIWHKEILYALSRHIEVYGASSMGALRAAELQPFGMTGVGEIFNAFFQGRLEDDDEVTVVHRPALSGYAPVTDAMVNIRATLEKALNENIVSPQEAENLRAIAKNLFYKKRLLNTAMMIFEKKYPETSLEVLRNWLKSNFVDQKEKDAMTLLHALKKDFPVKKICFELQPSIILQKLVDQHQCEPVGPACAEKEAENERYARLLAYIMKTRDVMNLSIADIEDRIKHDKEISYFLYCLAILFHGKDFNTFLSQEKYLKIMLFSAFMIFQIHNSMQEKKIALNAIEKETLHSELRTFLPEKYSPVLEKIFINVYFILKEIINNSTDRFLGNNTMLSDKAYFKIAQEILLLL